MCWQYYIVNYSYIASRRDTSANTHTHARTHTHTRTRTLTRARTRAHAHTHTHTHTHTRTKANTTICFSKSTAQQCISLVAGILHRLLGNKKTAPASLTSSPAPWGGGRAQEDMP